MRALLFTPDGRVVAEGSRPTAVERPRPGGRDLLTDEEAADRRNL